MLSTNTREREWKRSKLHRTLCFILKSSRSWILPKRNNVDSFCFSHPFLTWKLWSMARSLSLSPSPSPCLTLSFSTQSNRTFIQKAHIYCYKSSTWYWHRPPRWLCGSEKVHSECCNCWQTYHSTHTHTQTVEPSSYSYLAMFCVRWFHLFSDAFFFYVHFSPE